MVQRLEETGRTGQDGKFRGHFCHFARRFFAQAGCLGGLGRPECSVFCRSGGDDSRQQALAENSGIFRKQLISGDTCDYPKVVYTQAVAKDLPQVLPSQTRLWSSAKFEKGDVCVCRSGTAELNPTSTVVQQPLYAGKTVVLGGTQVQVMFIGSAAGAMDFVSRGKQKQLLRIVQVPVSRSRSESAGRRRVTLPWHLIVSVRCPAFLHAPSFG